MLDCGHSFCLTCISKLDTEEHDSKLKVQCPTCKAPTVAPSLYALRKNYSLIQLLASLQPQTPKTPADVLDSFDEAQFAVEIPQPKFQVTTLCWQDLIRTKMQKLDADFEKVGADFVELDSF